MKKLKETKGITLIALVITIIVLLILAAVSIATLTGENGILTKARTAKEKTSEATAKEKVQVAVMGSYGSDGKINREELKDNLRKIEGIKEVPEIPDGNFTIDVNVDGYVVTIKNTGEVTLKGMVSEDNSKPTFDPNTLTIGTAINTDKYGQKVSNYTVTTDEFTTGVWRLFFQDNNYTYLITDECVGNYNANDHYNRYQTGADVSIVGQKLNPMISTLFTENNTNENIRAIAWLTDQEIWSSYEDNNAVFALASPTLELFAASYNNRSNKSTILEVSFDGSYGYDFTGNTEISVEENYGIYNKSQQNAWWIASPYRTNDDICELAGHYRMIQQQQLDYTMGIRPVIGIPTSIFNSKYTLANE